MTAEPEEAARLVAAGTPVVLVGESAVDLGRQVRETREAREGLLAVMLGASGDPAVQAAALEIAGELWPGREL